MKTLGWGLAVAATAFTVGMQAATAVQVRQLRERVVVLEARAEASEAVADLAFKTVTRCATRDDVAAEAAQRDTVDTRLGHRIWLLEREYPVGTR